MPGEYPPNLTNVQEDVYRTVGDVELKIYTFNPEGHQSSDRRAAIVFFFGGGFKQGSPAQFEQHCKYFASRGMVALTADYRVSSRHDTEVIDAVQDGMAAMSWVRANSESLGIDPDRIAASGGSAGGLIAACVGVVPELNEDAPASSVPNVMVLFNPAGMGESLGRIPESILPYHHMKKGIPPVVMMFGTEDRLLEGARQFDKASQGLGNQCELLLWDGKGHGFFNYGKGENTDYLETTRAADRFLASLGYTEGEPTIEMPVTA